ncbi:peptidase S8/S53 domain-containing protein, partial [Obelidium mucronatum]
NLTRVNEYKDSSGKRVVVCTIDSGVDYTHPDLGGCFGKGCRVSFGYDFAGDAFNPPDVVTPSPKLDPMDCNGHGTHVAGIIMAVPADPTKNTEVTGIAPNVMFGTYKVFGCSGAGTNTALILKAMDQAYKDGCTIVNLSLGTSDVMEDSPEAISATQLAKRGLVLVVAAGNDQELGAFRITSPAISNGVLAVGSVENIRTMGRTLRVSGDSTGFQMPFTFPSKPPTESAGGKIKTGEAVDSQAQDDGCKPYPKDFFKGYIALIRRLGCTFAVKIQNAYDAGATSVILYNNVDQTIGTVLNPLANVVAYTVSSGEYLVQQLQVKGNGNVEVVFGQTNVGIDVANGGRMSTFSSWGLSTDWDLKPDVVAPGGQIYSTYPMNMGGYAVLSGTSMASPHLTGIYALAVSNTKSAILSTLRLDVINTLIKITSVPVALPSATSPPGFVFAPVALQGNGLVDIMNITEATTFIYPAALQCKVNPWNSNDAAGEPETRLFQIVIANVDSISHNYSFSHQQAAHVSIEDPLNPKIFAALPNSTVVRFPEVGGGDGLGGVVVVGVNETVSVVVSIRGPSKEALQYVLKDSTAWFFSGWVHVLDEEGKKYTLSYGGSVGDFKKFVPIDTVNPK